MATRQINTGRGLAPLLPTALLAQAVPMLTHHELEALVERLIEALDDLDGDVDGFENDTEDAFAFSRYAEGYHTGPGCPISDPGDAPVSEDEPDFLYANPLAGDGLPGCPISDPDVAADDVPCDEPFQDLEPEEERDLHLDYRLDQSAGPLPPHLSNDAALRKPHIARIRRELGAERLRHPDYRGRTHYLRWR